MVDMKKDAIVSVIGSIVLFSILLYALDKGLVNLSDISSAVAYVLVFGILGLLGWGFRETIEKALKHESKREMVPPVQVKHSESSAVIGDIQTPQFDAELSPKEGLRVGDMVTFKARFSGILVNGYLGTEVRFRNRIVGGCHDYTTIPRRINAFTKGKLNGFIDRRFEWTWVIPHTFPTGKYEFDIRVHNHFPLSTIGTIRLKLILWLKKHLLSSIDLNQLSYPERPMVDRKIETVIVSERTGFSA